MLHAAAALGERQHTLHPPLPLLFFNFHLGTPSNHSSNPSVVINTTASVDSILINANLAPGYFSFNILWTPHRKIVLFGFQVDTL
jgi:hypothetical protein